MRESASDRTAKYVETTLGSLGRLKVRNVPSTIARLHVHHVLGLVRSYVKDAQHYGEKRKPITSLACIAYAEGLLDALKFLDLVDF